MPPQLSSVGVDMGRGFNIRAAEDHIISPNMVNHIAWGITSENVPKNYHALDQAYTNVLPQIPGLPYPKYPPSMNFSSGFESFDGANFTPLFDYTSIWNDLLEWAHGKHTFKFGGEYRRMGLNTWYNGNTSGSFYFGTGETGLLGLNSDNPIASFLLGQVDSASVTDYGLGGAYYPRQSMLVAHFGDTWKVTPKLTVTYGTRYEVHKPPEEKYNHLSFFDPSMPNPGAGDIPGALAFAGTNWGPASFGKRYPEEVYYGDFGPRLGVAYSVNAKTVVRTRYGIFYSDSKYPGWGMGLGTEGFDANPSFSSSLGGMQAAFLLNQGFPTNYSKPPFIDASYANGLGAPIYRAFEGNRIPYSQQWDLAVENQFTNNFYVSAAYVGNKGTRLYSATAPLGALNPSLLSMGAQLYDQFGPTDTAVDGVPAPYSGWASQLSACAPTVAQALSQFPQSSSPPAVVLAAPPSRSPNSSAAA